MAGKKKSKLSAAFIMDPIEDMNVDTDTTLVIMLEAQRRGHELFYFTQDRLRVEHGRPVASMFPVRVRWPRSTGAKHFTLKEPVDRELSSMDLVFMRKDPPYTIEYVTALQVLHLVPPPTVVINRPRGVLLANEKLMAMHFPELMPATMVSRDPERLLKFLDRAGGKMIVKPVPEFGGLGVFLVEKDHTNKNAIIENATQGGTREVVAQEYLPVEKKGDKRIIMLAGEPIGAVLRMPAKGDHRANVHSGGSVKKTTITDRDGQICKQAGPWLRREGIYIAGLDIVAGMLTEINVTSPTLVQEINRTKGVKLERNIMEFCEYLAASAKAARK